MPETTPSASLQTIDLGAGGQLHITPGEAGAATALRVCAADGTPRLQLRIDADELVIDCLGGRTRLRVAGALAVSADSVDLSATHDLALRCGGDLTLAADGRIDARAGALALDATRGDVAITANDDVRLEGERVRMNA
ncbi:hypothetical protein [Variovorax sp. PAMC 28711]|uniref:hypothetical protein n=1 Tax=Variovorax sp. PAMC 28711 TaxID=1795631 RepID=UPI00078BA7F0|nr:hypothetical protein [Variovorax sp. PAMC 28711]AMM25107.1 hypothetical protein AX767_12585 [Variovorax sp. PAMC 28711]